MNLSRETDLLSTRSFWWQMEDASLQTRIIFKKKFMSFRLRNKMFMNLI